MMVSSNSPTVNWRFVPCSAWSTSSHSGFAQAASAERIADGYLELVIGP
jgi:hypothetical protein